MTGSQLVLLQDVGMQCHPLFSLESSYRHQLATPRLESGQCLAKSMHGGEYAEVARSAEMRCVLSSPEHWVTVANTTAAVSRQRAPAQAAGTLAGFARATSTRYRLTLWLAAITAAGLLAVLVLWALGRLWYGSAKRLRHAVSRKASEMRHLQSFASKLRTRYAVPRGARAPLQPLPAMRVGTRGSPDPPGPGRSAPAPPPARALHRDSPSPAPPPGPPPEREEVASFSPTYSFPRSPTSPVRHGGMSPTQSFRFSPRRLLHVVIPGPGPPAASPRDLSPPATSSTESRDAGLPRCVSPSPRLSPRHLGAEVRRVSRLLSPRHLDPRHTPIADLEFHADGRCSVDSLRTEPQGSQELPSSPAESDPPLSAAEGPLPFGRGSCDAEGA